MASLGRVVDVGIVDEIQLLADKSRGWAFTRALLGLPARTLHVCGDPAALPLLERLCQEAGASCCCAQAGGGWGVVVSRGRGFWQVVSRGVVFWLALSSCRVVRACRRSDTVSGC
jgi:hypothetical protein